MGIKSKIERQVFDKRRWTWVYLTCPKLGRFDL